MCISTFVLKAGEFSLPIYCRMHVPCALLSITITKKEDLIEMAKVEIRSESCKSCGYCVKFCPKGVLAVGEKVNSKGYEYVVPVNMDACIACCICARMCPDAAIEVYK